MPDRGQSELLGYLNVFAIVVFAVGVVLATGFTGLQDARDFERTNNAERGLVVLADNVDEVAVDGVPSRATELDLDGASLSRGEPVTITVSGEAVGDPTNDFSHTYTYEPLVYDPGTRETLVYSNGAVVRDGDDGAAVVRGPPAVLTDDRLFLPVIRTTVRGQTSLARSGTALVRTRREGGRLVERRTTAFEVTLTIDSPRAAAWAEYLDRRPGVDCSLAAGGSATSCTLTTDRVYLTVIDVSVRFR